MAHTEPVLCLYSRSDLAKGEALPPELQDGGDRCLLLGHFDQRGGLAGAFDSETKRRRATNRPALCGLELAPKMQESYGRIARILIERGECQPSEGAA
jgi:hypothetical protein